MILRLSRAALAVFFVFAGVMHFIAPEKYLAIVPPILPWPLALIYLSGAAEIAGGLGVLFRLTRREAGVGLIALLVAVFPANIYGALHGMRIGDWEVPTWMLWTRLPLQALLIWWVWNACWESEGSRAKVKA
ncbi:MAG: DoxX family protein [Chthoniobacterales bacterium]